LHLLCNRVYLGKLNHRGKSYIHRRGANTGRANSEIRKFGNDINPVR
jgi:hypothetical protein